MQKTLVLLVICVTILVTGNPCPKSCVCHSSWLRGITSVVVDCSKKGLTEIPTKGIPKYITSFVLNGNLITEIPRNVFTKYRYLREIYLYKNFIVKIDVGAFDGLRRLTELSLHSNQIKRIENGTFKGLRNLKRLYLFTNLLQDINEGVFAGLQELRTLYLHENLLRQIPPNTFSPFRHLSVLTLHRNYLQVLESGVFSGLRSVSQIYCHQNKISQIEAKVFEDCESLQKLQLGNNLIGELNGEMFLGLSQCRELYLDNNVIRKINDSAIFKDLVYLEKLVLLGNKIEFLGQGVFKDLYGLTILSLSGNQLSYLNRGIFTGLSSLNTLFLQENKIEWIEPLAFEGLRVLQRLYLFRNNIFYIRAKTFYGLFSLNELNLGVNDITGLANNAFLGLPRLLSLQLNSNRITMIPSRAFSKLRNLYRLVLYFNKISVIAENAFGDLKRLRSIIWYPPLMLVKSSKMLRKIKSNRLHCDCNTKWLKYWLMGRRDVKAIIYCDQPGFLKGWNVTEVEDRHMKCDQMTVTLSPKLSVQSANRTVYLQCGSNVLVNFTWVKNGSAVNDNENVFQTTSGLLVIHRLTVDDAGEYTCLISNGSLVLGANAIVKLGVKPSIMTEKERFINVTEPNKNIVLRCQSSGYPLPLLIWYFNGKLIQDGIDDRFIGHDGRLILTKISSKDNGIYQCIVTNQVGYDKKIYSLIYSVVAVKHCKPTCTAGFVCRPTYACQCIAKNNQCGNATVVENVTSEVSEQSGESQSFDQSFTDYEGGDNEE